VLPLLQLLLVSPQLRRVLPLGLVEECMPEATAASLAALGVGPKFAQRGCILAFPCGTGTCLHQQSQEMHRALDLFSISVGPLFKFFFI
jgi:hypothetical protein